MYGDKMESCISCGSAEREKIIDDRHFPGTEIVRCGGCGLIYPHPRPSEQAVAEFYRTAYFAHEGALGDLKRNLRIYFNSVRAKNQYRWISSAAGTLIGDNPRMLELGCGYGKLLELFHRGGWQVRGIEPSEDCARYTASKFDDETVFLGTFENYDPGDEKFDLLVFSHVFEHFVAPENIIIKIREMLKPGGLLYLELPNNQSIYYHGNQFNHIPDFYFFDSKSLASFLDKHGFETLKSAHIEYRRVVPRYDGLGDALNYPWRALLDLFGVDCFVDCGESGLWLRTLARV